MCIICTIFEALYNHECRRIFLLTQVKKFSLKKELTNAFSWRWSLRWNSFIQVRHIITIYQSDKIYHYLILLMFIPLNMRRFFRCSSHHNCHVGHFIESLQSKNAQQMCHGQSKSVDNTNSKIVWYLIADWCKSLMTAKLIWNVSHFYSKLLTYHWKCKCLYSCESRQWYFYIDEFI